MSVWQFTQMERGQTFFWDQSSPRHVLSWDALQLYWKKCGRVPALKFGHDFRRFTQYFPVLPDVFINISGLALVVF